MEIDKFSVSPTSNDDIKGEPEKTKAPASLKKRPRKLSKAQHGSQQLHEIKEELHEMEEDQQETSEKMKRKSFSATKRLSRATVEALLAPLPEASDVWRRAGTLAKLIGHREVLSVTKYTNHYCLTKLTSLRYAIRLYPLFETTIESNVLFKESWEVDVVDAAEATNARGNELRDVFHVLEGLLMSSKVKIRNLLPWWIFSSILFHPTFSTTMLLNHSFYQWLMRNFNCMCDSLRSVLSWLLPLIVSMEQLGCGPLCASYAFWA